MSKITFIGDVMLGRMVGAKYKQQPYKIVSESLVKEARDADYVIANLESPVVRTAKTEGDHLQFDGNPDTLDELKWIDAFSLSNNHINDCGELGMDETVAILNEKGFNHNGLYQENYQPLLIEQGDEKITIVTVTDMMNIPFAEDNKWKTLRVGDEKVLEVIKEWKDKGWFVILFAHIGILFSRYPNPVTFDYLHSCIDNGAEAVVTAHSHCLGCMEIYKGVPIFHSLGDFVMDGNSFRRRRSGVLKLVIADGRVKDWMIIPAEINDDYATVSPSENVRRKMLKEYQRCSDKFAKNINRYTQFFKWQYKKEMVQHTCSTLSYLVHTKGICGMLKMVFMRFEEVGRMFKWVAKDRSKDRRDDDAIKADRKKFTQDELFKK